MSNENQETSTVDHATDSFEKSKQRLIDRALAYSRHGEMLELQNFDEDLTAEHLKFSIEMLRAVDDLYEASKSIEIENQNSPIEEARTKLEEAAKKYAYHNHAYVGAQPLEVELAYEQSLIELKIAAERYWDLSGRPKTE
jgi:hypothetical protein